MKQHTTHLIIILLFIIVSKISHGLEVYDPQRPNDFSDKKWSKLNTALEEDKLSPNTDEITIPFNRFGFAVSLSGNRALIGALGNYDEEIGLAGSVYVYDFDGVNWIETQRLTRSDGEMGGRFGSSVSLSGNRALVGAYRGAGAAYVFDFDGVKWNETQKLTASDADLWDLFGISVSLSGDRALIGAHLDDEMGSDSGSVYVFEYDGTTWNETQKLIANDGQAGDQFGISVSLSGNKVLIGANKDDDLGPNTGSAYVFDNNGVNWSQSQKLTAGDGATNDEFGYSVSLSGNRALIGAYRDGEVESQSGSAYVFDLNGENWIQSQKLKADTEVLSDWFGLSVSLSGNRALIGAPGTASAYMYELHGMNWNITDTITAIDGFIGSRFGHSVSSSGNRALIGAYLDNENFNQSGSAYIIFNDDLIYLNGFD